MKNLIRKWLGIDELQYKTSDIMQSQDRIELNQLNILKLKPQLEISLIGIGKIISKLEPTFIQDELDPVRKADSDRIGQEALDRLYAENFARKHSLGET